MKRSVAVLFAILAVIATVSAQDVKPSSSQTSPNVRQPPARETYRLDYTVTEIDEGKKLNSRTYSVMCEDEGSSTRGTLKVGSRVPVVTSDVGAGHGDTPNVLVPPQVTYLDLGMNIEARLAATADGGLSLQSDVEMSNVAASDPSNRTNLPVIRQLRVTTNNSITVGKPIVISTADDVASHRQFQIQVVATQIK